VNVYIFHLIEGRFLRVIDMLPDDPWYIALVWDEKHGDQYAVQRTSVAYCEYPQPPTP
jgi:hypothetical protein